MQQDIANITVCQGVVKRKMKKFIRKITEDAPANATGPAIPGTGDDAQAFPRGKARKNYKDKNEDGQDDQTADVNLMRRKTPMMEESERTGDYKTGTFAGSTTFVVPSNIFHEARLAKKKGKHWRTYIGEEDHWRHIRGYANKHPKKAIILQDERTGAMCYARYGKKNDLMEAPLLSHIGKKQKINMETGIRTKEEHAGEKVAKVDKEHDLHHTSTGQTYGDRYMVRHRATGKIVGTVSGTRNKKTGTFTIDAADSTGKGPKMHKVYRKILQSGHSKTIVGISHSPGGQRIWQKLSTERGVSVHGWKGGKKGKPVNLDPKDPEETHISDREVARDKDASAKDIYRTKLVASLHKRKVAK